MLNSEVLTPNLNMIERERNQLNVLAKKSRPPPLNIGYNELGILPNRVVLYRNFHKVCEKLYLVEISKS
jgi:hypothetical protein